MVIQRVKIRTGRRVNKKSNLNAASLSAIAQSNAIAESGNFTKYNSVAELNAAMDLEDERTALRTYKYRF